MSQTSKTKSGKLWLTEAEAIAEFPFWGMTLRIWRRTTCGPLGRPIRTKPIKNPNRGPNGRKEIWGYNRKDLERLMSLPDLDKGKYENARGIWWTWRATFQKFGFGGGTLKDWRKDCGPLRRKISAKHVWMRASHSGIIRRFWVYLEADLERIVQWMNEPTIGSWPSRSEAYEQYGLSEQSFHRWETKGCPALDGKKILLGSGYRREYRAVGNHYRRVKVYNPTVLKQIATAYAEPVANSPWLPEWRAENEYGILPSRLKNYRQHPDLWPLAGKPKPKQRNGCGPKGRLVKTWCWRRNDLDKLSRLLQNVDDFGCFHGVFEDGPPGTRRISISLAAIVTGLSKAALLNAIINKRLAALKMPVPPLAGHRREEWSLLESDAKELVTKIRTTKPTGWKTASELATQFGITCWAGRKRLYSNLRELRETGQIEWWRPILGGPNAKRGRPPYYYDPDKTPKLLAVNSNGETPTAPAPAVPASAPGVPTDSPSSAATKPARKRGGRKRTRDKLRDMVRKMPDASAKEIVRKYNKVYASRIGSPDRKLALPKATESAVWDIKSELKADQQHRNENGTSPN